jgi:non-lysosomal glucosylceramidase
MKINRLLVFLCCLLPLTSQGGDLFNPAPSVIESPRDDAAFARLTTNSEGKTPVVKNLDAAWIKTLADRGEPKLYTKANSKDFAYIGMPIGGIGAGELYLSGDGRLWGWDIFNTRCVGGFPVELGLAYVSPHTVGDPADITQTLVEQGFVLRTKVGDKVDTRTLDKKGFADVEFSGQYPIGKVSYSDPACPVQVKLEAFSPYIPGSVKDSSYPATIFNYTLENTSADKVECTLGGWLENPIARTTRGLTPAILETKASRGVNYAMLGYSVATGPSKGANGFDIINDFQTSQYKPWKVEKEAPPTDTVGHAAKEHWVNYSVGSYFHGDAKFPGKLISPSFVIKRPWLTFLISGGDKVGTEGVNLVVDGQVVQTATVQMRELLHPVAWDVKNLVGKTAHVEITLIDSQFWGHLAVYDIAQADQKAIAVPLEKQIDAGSMGFAAVRDATSNFIHAGIQMVDDRVFPEYPIGTVEVIAQVNGPDYPTACLDAPAADSAQVNTTDPNAKLVGAVRRHVTLAPGEKVTLSFIVSWYFPNPMTLGLQTSNSRQYGSRFKSAQAVVEHLATDFTRLTDATRQWNATWYDSTLPYWFLDRTFLNASTLATSTFYALSDGRYYGYEGRYSCTGTCTHVYGYQQVMGFLFPEIERNLREKVDFVNGFGMNPEGGIAMRDEWDKNPPVDGQSGIILRTYLAHRMSADDSFLKRNYASVKKAANYLVNKYDAVHAGILVGPQGNTMDAAWYGNNTWMSLYYQAALRATAEMADTCNDGAYAKSLRVIADKGRSFIESQLFNGEYFIHQPDAAHPESPGTYNGCTLEELMGQNWAYQVGLGDIVDSAKAHTALDSIWKYDYTTDAGQYRNVFKEGRWYANAGEGGLIMCTFPHGGEDTLKKGNTGFSAYDNECWPGSEYEITASMMWEGQVDKALAEIKTLQERFDGAKRNPWNECECGSHYSRSMASYGVFTAACGFDYDGPKGEMAFAPRVQPENFKAAFTAAEGWGSFSQKYNGAGLDASLDLRYGKLRLKTLSLVLPAGNLGRDAKVTSGGKEIPVTSHVTGNRISLAFHSDVILTAGQALAVTIR